jgi:hypothetical protein
MHSSRTRNLLPILALGAALLPVYPLGAQLTIGPQLSATEYETEGLSTGVGGRATLSFPETFLSLQAASDMFRRDCGMGTCWHQEMGVNLLLDIPMATIVKPYIGGGVTLDMRYGSNLGWSFDEFDLNALGGLRVQEESLGRFQPFVEGRYTTREGQSFLSVGLLFVLIPGS